MISIKGGTATYDTPVKEWVVVVDRITHRVKTLDQLAGVVEITDQEIADLIDYKATQEAALNGSTL